MSSRPCLPLCWRHCKWQGPFAPQTLLRFIAVGSEEAPIEGLASVRHSNGTCSFPAFRFHEWLREVRREGISETRLPCPPESGPSASDLRTSNDRIVSSKRDVRVFHKGNFPSSRSFLIYLDRSKLDPFTNVLPRTTLDPPFPVTRVIRLALQVLLRSPTPGGASLPISLFAYRVAYPV